MQKRPKRDPDSRKDSGTFYRDIAFVPSGTLISTDTTSSSALTSSTREKDAVDVHKFYQAILAMPRTGTPRKSKKPRIQSSSSSTPSTTAAPTSTQVGASGTKVIGAKGGSNSTASSPLASAPSINAQPPPTLQQLSSPSSSPLPQSKGATVTSTLVATLPAKDSRKEERVQEFILCKSCQIEVRTHDLERHLQGTAHLISQESAIKPLDTLTLGHENKGFRMLVNSGWEYEKGLGSQGQGARHPVATRLKHDRLALGAPGTSKKVVTHTFQEIEQSRAKPGVKSNRRVPLSAEDYRRKAEKERRDRVDLMAYMKN